MSAEISRAERLKTDFISSVSHELRTPLTAIAGWGETLLSPDMDNLLDVKKGIRIMLKESRRLTKLVEELLEFTRMEGGRMTMHMETIDIEAEFEESVYMYMDLLRKEDLVLEYFAGDDIPQISGDRERLKQVFYNLFDNAAKHGKEGGKITASIDFEPEHGQIVIRIQDFGPGIPEDELPLVKRKFYKGSSKARGSGIGLAISDEIIKLHDGEFEILSALGEGTTAVIRLPAAINYPAQGV